MSKMSAERLAEIRAEMEAAAPPEPPLKKKRKRTPITGAEWIITLQLTVGDDDTQVGESISFKFADSYVASHEHEMGRVIVRALNDQAKHLRKLAKGKR